jgi:hypothetical protein
MKFITRLIYGLIFAIPLMMVSFALAQASDQYQEENPSQPLECKECHQAFYDRWENSAHGNATSDPAFRESWEKQGQPNDCLVCHVTGFDPATGTWDTDGISCEACHSPITENHPKEPMAADRSANLCSNCHPETYFEWQVSAHRAEGLDCYGCHDPHGTALKAESAALLCSSCHRERSSNFTHSAHSEQGLTCATCHLANLNANPTEGQSGKDHSFFVSLEACNSCHVYQMHDPVEVHPEHPTPPPPDALAAVEEVTVMEEPVPVSPIGFTTLSGLIGIALGVVIAPWIERLQRGSRIKDEE